MDNETRIDRAALAVGAYIFAAQQPAHRYCDEPIADVITDLLSDLRHFCADRDIDFAVLSRSPNTTSMPNANRRPR